MAPGLGYGQASPSRPRTSAPVADDETLTTAEDTAGVGQRARWRHGRRRRRAVRHDGGAGRGATGQSPARAGGSVHVHPGRRIGNGDGLLCLHSSRTGAVASPTPEQVTVTVTPGERRARPPSTTPLTPRRGRPRASSTCCINDADIGGQRPIRCRLDERRPWGSSSCAAGRDVHLRRRSPVTRAPTAFTYTVSDGARWLGHRHRLSHRQPR